MISGEMKLLLACVFVGSVLAGKTNPCLSFFSSEMYLIGTCHCFTAKTPRSFKIAITNVEGAR